MASANLQSKISLDDSNFKAGMRRVQTSAKTGMAAVRRSAERVGRSMAQLGGKIKRVGMIIGAITFAGAIAGAAAFARGIKGAIDAGGALSDLSSRTGIAVSQLVVLQQAFKDNGLAAEKVGPIINKMQKGITDFGNGLSTQVRAFEALGIKFEDIEKLSPAEQFKAIQKAIVAIEDPTRKAGIAMDVFGRAGGELQALFDDAGAMGKASVTVGAQAELLEKNAATFNRVSDLLTTAGTKIQGFFVGIADVFAPQILSALESINKLDFTQFGQNLASSVKAGEMKDVLVSAFNLAVVSFGNGMINAIGDIASSIEKVLGFAIDLQMHKLRNVGRFFAGKEQLEIHEDETLVKDALRRKKIEEQKKANPVDVFGEKEAQADFDRKLAGMKSSFKMKAQSDLAGAPLSMFKDLLESEESTPTASPKPSQKQGGNFLAGLLQAGMQAMKNVTGSKTLGESAYRMEAAGHRQAGFSGLGGLAQMQADRLSGIGPGENSIFAQDRKRLGIKSGLSITGLNEVKKAKDKEGIKGDRVGSSLVDVNVKLNKANGYYEEMITKLDEGLAS